MAEKPNFTPGPWLRREHRGELVGSNGSRVCIYDAGIALAMTPDDESRANARLIEAAPVLYAALHLIESLPEEMKEAGSWDTATLNRVGEIVSSMTQAALKLARGEG